MSFLTLSDLRKTFPDGTEAVKGIELSVQAGEFVVLLGPSGCGKTTTLRMIAGLEMPTSGRIVLDGSEVAHLRPSQRDVGFVFQFYALYPHLSVRQNISFPLESSGASAAQIDAHVRNVSERVGLRDLLDRHPRQLSGGDQQRVALARAMVRKPRIWLMDEPLGTLDADQRLEMREFIRKQQLDMKITTTYVTHDQEEAMTLADRIVVMDQGVIRQAGTPDDVYDRPADLFVANFVGSPGMNFIEGTIGESGGFVTGVSGTVLPIRGDLRPGKVILGIRPEHVRPASDGPVAGKVIVREFLGSYRLLHIDSDIGRVIARTDQLDGAPGEPIRLELDAFHMNFFDPVTGKRL